VRPNATTAFAVSHPYLWAWVSALLVAFVGWALFQDLRPVIPASIVVGLAQAMLWRPGGPGRRWADRRSSSHRNEIRDVGPATSAGDEVEPTGPSGGRAGSAVAVSCDGWSCSVGSHEGGKSLLHRLGYR
jgi:hypothetical protein